MTVSTKVTATHLARNAYLYVRQSTLRQVAENQESTKRQYGLRERASALGWHTEQIQVIDADLGQSGASAAAREGFQHLVAEVGLGRAGIVLGLEVSRLARNCADWHRLLEICAMTATLILDEDGVYDPAQYNDRLLLGLKGTMSEAELHMLRSRLQGGLLAKARRGELKVGLPVGLVYDATDRIVLHPDKQVSDSVSLLFETFRRTGSACATVKAFRQQKLLFPAQVSRSHRDPAVMWRPLNLSRVIHVLNNPAYAGAYTYGRHRTRHTVDGRLRTRSLPRDEWTVLLLDHHPGYIDWAGFEGNQRRLADNTKSGLVNQRTPPREGAALLQGLALCGFCGARMGVTYHHRKGRLIPAYFCCRRILDEGRTCQSIAGDAIDDAVGELVVKAMTPMALQLTVAIQDELQSRIDEADSLRQQGIQRAEYEVERARQRYMQVDPANRLVAGTLEADWNEALRALDVSRQEVERQRQAERTRYDQAARDRIAGLAGDFPALWADPSTPQRERKRMLALLIEDVTLLRGEHIAVHVRFRGGAVTSLTLPLPHQRKTDPEVVTAADALLDEHTDSEVATILNERGHATGAQAAFDITSIAWLRHVHHLPSLKQRLLAAGGLTTRQLAAQIGVTASVVRTWAQKGRVVARRCNERGERVFASLAEQPEPIRLLAAGRGTVNQVSPAAASDTNHVRGAV
jgi:DNA invertase Pin-like site-specific DNA recombinase